MRVLCTELVLMRCVTVSSESSAAAEVAALQRLCGYSRVPTVELLGPGRHSVPYSLHPHLARVAVPCRLPSRWYPVAEGGVVSCVVCVWEGGGGRRLRGVWVPWWVPWSVASLGSDRVRQGTVNDALPRQSAAARGHGSVRCHRHAAVRHGRRRCAVVQRDRCRCVKARVNKAGRHV